MVFTRLIVYYHASLSLLTSPGTVQDQGDFTIINHSFE